MQRNSQYSEHITRGLKTIKTIFVLFISVISSAQGRYLYSDTKKGQLTLSWGWNRDAYTHSNIRFAGDDYNFKLYKVTAHDRPTLPFSYHNYLQFNRLTIPQTNLRVSYFIKDKLAISAGVDHMKYVMDQNQVVKMKGTISQQGIYKGEYNGDLTLTSDFLTFEHTDGLNYINVELEKYFSWYHSASSQFILSGYLGGGAGVLFPKTNVKLLDYEKNDRFHISGFGLSVKAGLQATFFKHLVLKFENKYGYINMPDIILHKKGIPGRAKQSFLFVQGNIMLGASFALAHPKKTKKEKTL
jgi:hypothetical protein